MKKIQIIIAISMLSLGGCAATNFSEDVNFKPIEGKPGFIYNPEYKDGFTPDNAPRPNLK